MSGTMRRAALVLAAATTTLASGFLGAPPAHAAVVYTVNSNADDTDGSCDALSGTTDCTLREAIAAANNTTTSPGLDTIRFDLPTGQTTIVPGSGGLPLVTDPTFIDGFSQPGSSAFNPVVQLDGSSAGSNGVGLWLSTGSGGSTVRGLVVNRFVSQQVLVDSPNTTVSFNHIGVNLSGTAISGGGAFGILRFRVGADSATAIGNVVASGDNAPAIGLEDVGGAFINGNYVGISRSGSSIGSGPGVTAIRVSGASASGNRIVANSVDGNGGLGIDLGANGVTANDPGDGDTGANGLQNFPVLTSATTPGTATTVTGTLDSTPSTAFDLDFFASPVCDPSGNGEGREYLTTRSVTTGADGTADFEFEVGDTSIEDQITATATSPAGGTSEFSECAMVLPPPPPPAPQGVTAAAGDGEAEVAWLASTPSGGGTVDSYQVSSVPDTDSTPITASGGQTEIVVPGLSNGTEYTFTVTAFKDGQQSPASDPSDPVTPRADAPPPEAATGSLDPGGQLTTGSGATASDPTNTTVVSPNGGVVSVAESVTEQPAPDGGAYYGQQVDITAPDATASDPLRFTFVADCSVLPEALRSCADPPENPRTTISVRDGSFAPRQATVDLGGTVTWRFTGKRRHSVTESVGLGARRKPLFDSGARSRGARFSQAFRTAGTYAYRSKVRGDPRRMSGTVGVPLDVEPSGGGSAVTWSTGLPAGTAADVQYRHRATADDPWSGWTTWQDDVRTRSALLSAAAAGRGDYQLRSRLVNTRTGRSSGWSPRSVVTVGGHVAAIDLWHQTDLGVPATNEIVPDCTGPDGVADPAPSCVWSEEILPDGDLRIVVYSTINGRWRAG